ncbi:hypothetical protein M3Y97_00983300 [Aphelenchoides bicaudatus]|nr:hypothetical protein M3Y97_00983300 [Aphelenchoides bicaudatus]
MVKAKREIKAEEVEDETMETSTTTSTIRLPAVEKEEYARLCTLVNPIATPLAGRRMAKKIYKLLKSLKDSKDALRSGLSDVMKGLRKEETGIIVLAGDVWPIDMYSHIPALCEERQIPYIYTPSKKHLGLSVGFTRPFVAVMIKRTDENAAVYDDLHEAIKQVDLTIE